MLIKVYAPACGCSEKIFRLVEEAVQQSGAEVQVEKIQDYAAMARAGIMTTPVIEINGQVVAKGRTPKVSELVSWIRATRD